MGLLYRGKLERPLSRVERRQLVVLAVATVIGMIVAIVGVMLLMPTGRNRLSPVLMLTGTLVVAAAGFISMRHLVSVRRRQFQAAMIAGLALLWLLSVVAYLNDW